MAEPTRFNVSYGRWKWLEFAEAVPASAWRNKSYGVDYGKIAWLYYSQGYRQLDIADQLGISIGRVRMVCERWLFHAALDAMTRTTNHA